MVKRLSTMRETRVQALGWDIVFHPRSKRVLISWLQSPSMNQGKLDVVKQEMARVNIDVLGISEQKWTGMGEFNSDDHYIY